MAPSKETLYKGFLPIAPTTPVRVIAKLLQKLSFAEAKCGLGDVDEEVEGVDRDKLDGSDTESAADHEYVFGEEDDCSSEESAEQKRLTNNKVSINKAIRNLSKGTLASLVASGPITSSTELHLGTTSLISMHTHSTALVIEPGTLHERLLLAVLRESEAQVTFLQDRPVNLQAASILNGAYCGRLRG